MHFFRVFLPRLLIDNGLPHLWLDLVRSEELPHVTAHDARKDYGAGAHNFRSFGGCSHVL